MRWDAPLDTWGQGESRFRQQGAEGRGFCFYGTGLPDVSERFKSGVGGETTWMQISLGRGSFMLKHMKSYAHLKPGQNGTKRLFAQYGKSLLCIRYRYDEIRGVRIKTVELVVEERPGFPRFLLQDGDMVPIAVSFEEIELRERLRRMRARWDPEQKLWMVPYRHVRGTELEARIPEDFFNGCRRS
jgi:hypothetical protein